MCVKTKRYTVAMIAGQFVGMCGRTLRSFLFNALMFGFGFGCCYMYAVRRVDTAPSDLPPGQSMEEVCDASLDSSILRYKLRVYRDAGTNGVIIVEENGDVRKGIPIGVCPKK